MAKIPKGRYCHEENFLHDCPHYEESGNLHKCTLIGYVSKNENDSFEEQIKVCNENLD